MKTSVKNSNFKRIALIALLIFGSIGIQANPLNYILGSETTGLDIVYIVLGISAIWMLIFFEGYTNEDKAENSSVKIRSSEENHYHKKVVRKTS